ncbi:Chaperone protein htpG family protein [Trifolium repens]|nr:Chaperone protein htpG family protein [Trifolium repens]
MDFQQIQTWLRGNQNQSRRDHFGVTPKKFEFQTEVLRLMDIIINSLYGIGQENLGEGDNAKLEVQDVDEKQCMILPVHLETLGRMIT